LNENNRAVVALLVGFVVGVVVSFDGAFAVFSMMFGPLAANFGTHFRKSLVELDLTKGGACA
jgi:hypothetical protein